MQEVARRVSTRVHAHHAVGTCVVHHTPSCFISLSRARSLSLIFPYTLIPPIHSRVDHVKQIGSKDRDGTACVCVCECVTTEQAPHVQRYGCKAMAWPPYGQRNNKNAMSFPHTSPLAPTRLCSKGKMQNAIKHKKDSIITQKRGGVGDEASSRQLDGGSIYQIPPHRTAHTPSFPSLHPCPYPCPFSAPCPYRHAVGK